jgi:hypothetical protein
MPSAAVVIAFLTLAAPLLFLLLQLPQQLQLADGFSTRDIDDAPMAVSGENVYVVWWSNRTGQLEVMFRASHDSGRTFEDKINLSNSTGAQSIQATVAASGDNVYVTYLDNKTGNEETYVRTSTDRGQTFGPAIMINGTGTEPREAEVLTQQHLGFDLLQDAPENTQIAASGNNVYVVVWGKEAPENWEVFFSRSTDGGQTFEDAINLSNTPDVRSDKAILLADGENVYVTWWETARDRLSQAVMRVSNDNGQTFGPVVMLSANGTISTTTATAANTTTTTAGEE